MSMRVEIKDFTDHNSLAVRTSTNDSLGKLIVVSQHMGCMSFVFSMRSSQARKMADVLIAAADEMDAEEELLEASP